MGYFFEKRKYRDSGIQKAYYTYLGYKLKKNTERGSETHPIFIYFGKDEVSVCYQDDTGRVTKIFSLYVAEGMINQEMLAKKIEDYARMPLWPISETGIIQSEERGRLCLDPTLLRIGFFPRYYGFSITSDNRFEMIDLPGSRSGVTRVKNGGKRLEFMYWLGETASPAPSVGTDDGNASQDVWEIDENGEIIVRKINFSMLLLDFLFEMDYADTFEDENFFALQPHLQNNLVLDALTRKCRYLLELSKLRDFEQTKKHERLPKHFRQAERDWLNVCRLVDYKSIFVSPTSLFNDSEEEVKHIFFDARIGKGCRPRRAFLKTKDDAPIKNEVCRFFMGKYDILRAFRMALPDWSIPVLWGLLLLIPFGDLFLPLGRCTGCFTIFSPLLFIVGVFVYRAYKGVNLFKLFLPRLFLGIIVGWAVFWSTEELWKKALTMNFEMILASDAFMLLIIFLYIYTDIGNQMYRRNESQILKKTFSLIGMAMAISFVVGFYVLQFYARPIIQNSGFLEYNRIYKDFKAPTKNPPRLDEVFTKEKLEGKYELNEKYKYLHFLGERWRNYRERLLSPLFTSNAQSEELFNGRIIVIWSVLLSQFIVAIFVGVILQLIWEDRPITEPL